MGAQDSHLYFHTAPELFKLALVLFYFHHQQPPSTLAVVYLQVQSAVCNKNSFNSIHWQKISDAVEVVGRFF